jgi:transcriptional regulator NrdR family protein
LALQGLATEYLLNYIVERLTVSAAEPNGEVTTDQISEIVLDALGRSHRLAFLRSAVHHRMMRLSATDSEFEEMGSLAGELVSLGDINERHSPQSLPQVRELPPPILCPRCGSQRVARRSHVSTVRGLEQQPASCSNCGQKYTWEWGSHVPLLVTSEGGVSLFDLPRFRAGIRSAVRKLPGAAAIWSDEKLIASAAHTASISATPYIFRPSPEHPFPSISSEDLWLAAASALRSIHPLAFVRFALHSRALDEVDWEDKASRDRLSGMERIVQGITRRYFQS